MRFLVTAGNTRERIDQVRDWGNIFTGNTGYAIAQALGEIGQVDLASSNQRHLAEVRAEHSHITGLPFTTHAELTALLNGLLSEQTYDAIFMTAAVSDYQPQRVYAVVDRQQDPDDPKTERWTVQDVQSGKVRSSHKLIAILGQPTEKIIDMFRGRWGYKGLLVKFKLEVGLTDAELLRIAEASRSHSDADYLVANTLDMVSGQKAGAYLLWAGGNVWLPRDQLPRKMVELAKRGKPQHG